MMKKILACCIACILVLSVSAVAFANNSASKPDMVKEAQAVKAVLSEQAGKSDEQIGEICGQPVYNNEFEIRYQKAVASGSENPYEDTVKSMKKIKSDYKFAEDHNIAVTDKEVLDYTNQQRDLYENQVDPQLKAGIKAIIDGLGMTEDEYWNQYKLKENKDYLTYRKVLEYQEESKAQPIDLDNVTFDITDKAYTKDNFSETK